MTRENKLALVVGFGLILLVGILISDHFSTASSQQSAEFGGRAEDPLRRLGPDQSFITTNPAITASPNRGAEARPNEPVERAHGPAIEHAADISHADPPTTIRRPQHTQVPPPALAPIEMGAPAGSRIPQGLSSEPVVTAAGGSVRIHHVVAGESLTSITRSYYGADDLVDALAAFNDIEDPDRISLNRRLRIPEASVLRGGAPAPTDAAPERTASAPAPRTAPPAATPPATPPAPGRTYTVRNGDILSRIAARELGSSSHTRRLFEANRDVLRDMNDLRPGMVLRLPDVSS